MVAEAEVVSGGMQRAKANYVDVGGGDVQQQLQRVPRFQRELRIGFAEELFMGSCVMSKDSGTIRGSGVKVGAPKTVWDWSRRRIVRSKAEVANKSPTCT
jgi:hypothetical protein